MTPPNEGQKGLAGRADMLKFYLDVEFVYNPSLAHAMNNALL